MRVEVRVAETETMIQNRLALQKKKDVAVVTLQGQVEKRKL